MQRLLDNAIDALKAARAEDAGLAGSTRAKIVQAAWSEANERVAVRRPMVPLFRWLVVGGVIPVALLVVASFSLLPVPTDVEVAQAGPVFSDAQKVGGAVVFTIADGRDAHRVVRSTDPSRFNQAASQVVTDGRFLDRANSGPVVVFYKID